MDNWKFHKSKVASYWLIKLDSAKQRKVSGAYSSHCVLAIGNNTFNEFLTALVIYLVMSYLS